MKLFIDCTKFELGELLIGLKLYADLMERQIKVIQAEQKERLGKEWETFETVFTEAIPTNLRYSVIITLVSNVEWSLNYAVKSLKKRGTKLPRQPRDASENAHKIQFLKRQGIPEFTHPFEEKFLAIVTLRNAIVHNAGKPDRLVATVGWTDIHLFNEKLEEAGRKLQPAVVLDTNMWIEEGAVSSWIQDAHDWLSALYDYLNLSVGVEIPVSK